MDRPATTRVGATINPNPEKPWRPFTRQRDVPTDGTWFVARSTTPGWAATRVVRYRSKTDRLPTDDSGEMWPSEPTEWMPLDEFAALAAPTVASDNGAGLLTYGYMRSGGRCDWRQLREAVSEAIRGTREVEPDERSDIYTGHRMVEGINYNSLDRIVTAFVEAALATDATAGATGGGHADTEGEAMAMFAHLNCPCCGGSGHIDDCATTPGGDLLEQAARLAESWQDPVVATDHENRISSSIAAAIRALSARNQNDGGGEK